jgi:hypothetical protein
MLDPGRASKGASLMVWSLDPPVSGGGGGP